MSQDNPKPLKQNMFSATNQPEDDARFRKKKSLDRALKAKLAKNEDGTPDMTQDIIQIAENEIKAVKEGKRPLTATVMRLIELVWERSEGPVKQETDMNLSGGIVVIPAAAAMDAELKKLEDKLLEDSSEDEDDD